jgi:hypothetical protein
VEAPTRRSSSFSSPTSPKYARTGPGQEEPTREPSVLAPQPLVLLTDIAGVRPRWPGQEESVLARASLSASLLDGAKWTIRDPVSMATAVVVRNTGSKPVELTNAHPLPLFHQLRSLAWWPRRHPLPPPPRPLPDPGRPRPRVRRHGWWKHAPPRGGHGRARRPHVAPPPPRTTPRSTRRSTSLPAPGRTRSSRFSSPPPPRPPPRPPCVP